MNENSGFRRVGEEDISLWKNQILRREEREH